MENKKLFRKKSLDARKSLDVLSISNKITKNIALWDNYKRAENVMLFYPVNSEISLLNLLKDKSKSFFFPAVHYNDILPVLYCEENGFKTGKFNIKEPVGEILTDYSLLDLILVPALAADLKGYRLGYGKGFYDRFLEHFNDEVVKAVPIASELLFESIPTETHDKKVQYIITENAVLSTIRSSLSN